MSPSDDDTPGPYGRLALFVLAHRKMVALGMLLVSLVAGVIGLPPTVDSNVLSMMDPTEPAIIATQALMSDPDGVEFHMLAFSPVGEPDPDGMARFLDELSVKIEATGLVRYELHELDNELAYTVGMLQLLPDDVDALTGRLKAAVALGPALNPVVTQRLLSMGGVTDRMAKAQEAAVFTQGDGTGRMMIRPEGPATDPDFSKRFVDAVDAALEASDLEGHGVQLDWVGGPYRHLVEDIRNIQGDLMWTGAGSVVLVLLVITLAFRSIKSPLIVFLPLVMANLLTLAFVQVFVGSLNNFTSSTLAILIGLGIDFAVHLLGRYRELRGDGHSLEKALQIAWDRTGPPCTAAALTSVAGFMALVIAQFHGFAQLGWILSFGLVACLVCMLVGLPLLIPLLDAEPKKLVGQANVPTQSTSSYKLAPLGLSLVVIVTAVAAGLALPRIEFNFDMSSLRNEGLAYDELTDEERKLAQASYSPLVVTYNTREQASEAHLRFTELAGTVDMPSVARVLSIENVMPLDQEARVLELEQLYEAIVPSRMGYLLRSAAKPMAETLIEMKKHTPHTLSDADFPKGLLPLLGAGTEGTHRVLLIPKGNMWYLPNALAFYDDTVAQAGSATVAGGFAATGTMYRLIMNDLPRVGALALFLIVVLAAIDLRRPHVVIGAVGTLLAGLAWAGVMLHLLGIQLTLASVVGVPILMGIGIDVVIHLLHRIEDEGPGGVRRALRTTGVAATISTLTTVASFFALTLAGNRGVQSLGNLVVVGLGTVFVVSAFVLPLAWAAGWKLSGMAPADQPSD